MQCMHKNVLIFGLIATVGCASMLGGPTTEELATVKIQGSQFEPTISVQGPFYDYSAAPLRSGVVNYYFIRSWIDRKTDSVTHQLYVTNHYSGDWKFWNQANSQDGQPLTVTSIDKSVGSCYGSCSLWESFGVDLADSLLRAHRSTGYAVKFYAHSSDTLVVRVPAAEIDRQLVTTDSIAKSMRRP